MITITRSTEYVTIKLHGQYDPNDMYEGLERFYCDHTSNKALIDTSRAHPRSETAGIDMIKLADQRDSLCQPRGIIAIRAAYWAPHSVNYDIIRMYQNVVEHEGHQIEVFSSKEAAVLWLTQGE